MNVLKNLIVGGIALFSTTVFSAGVPITAADLAEIEKKGASLEREFKWLGSYRYAVLNLGGLNRTDLFKRFRLLCQQLNFIDPLIKDQ